MNQIKIFIIVVVLLVVGVLVLAITKPVEGPKDPNKYDEFAQCLKDSGAIFYGAFWCPHCASQKKLFGDSQEFLPYVECSLPSGQGRTQQCIDEGVEGYPTWEFADGSRPFSGEVSLEDLAEKTGCVLPQSEISESVDVGGLSPAVVE